MPIREIRVWFSKLLPTGRLPKNAFEEKTDDRAGQLVNLIESTMDDLNNYGYSVFRLNYSGDVRYKFSNQQWGQDWDSGPNAGLHFNFWGFTCEVTWHGKYY